MAQTRDRLAGLSDNPVVRVVAYYILLAAGTALLWQYFPGLGTMFSANRLTELAGGRFTGQGPSYDPLADFGAGTPSALALATTTALCMIGAFLLMLPVAWIYIFTRQKKGFRQSVVQTLLILPIVVAAVVLLVKNSVALAFSLAGIVAAVSFRNTLRDTKDAVYIFLATGVGIAAGVQVIPAAATLSVLFNIAILILWWTDFGRVPAHLEGPAAARRLQRARALANRTGSFVSLVDQQLLKSMTPEQLDALAARASQRRRQSPDFSGERPKKALDTLLRVTTREVEPARRIVEGVLATHVKDWKFSRETPSENGVSAVEYAVRLKKSVSGLMLADEVRARGGAHVTGVEVK